ncbi:MAG: tRNA lysidine(34) synthetase TilS, partial [Pseudomonadota bacterium]
MAVATSRSNSTINALDLHFYQQLAALVNISEPIAIALSGGIDSMCLLALAKNLGINTVALIVNHNLRAETKHEINQLTQFLQHQQQPFKVLNWQHQGGISGNTQAQARYNRYLLTTDYCQQHGIKYLLTGHHHDDQLENFLMRQERGSGVVGLSGINKVIKINQINVVRPLLNLNKASLKHYLQQHQWPWWEDKSNSNPKYRRNYWRQQLLTMPEAEKNALACKICNYQQQAGQLRQEVTIAAQNIVCYNHNGAATVNYAQWLILPNEIKWHILLEVATTASGQINGWRGNQLTALKHLFINASHNINTTWHGCIWQLHWQRQILTVYREPAYIDHKLQLAPGECKYWDKRWLVNNNSDYKIKVLHLKKFNHHYWPKLKQQYLLKDIGHKHQ